jgi:hypothetical protein
MLNLGLPVTESDRSIRHGVVIWEQRDLRCTCLSFSPDRIEIRLVMNGVIVDRKVFADAGAAAAFALDKMRAYKTF